MRILVIAGGESSERAVSLRSGASVEAALKAAGHSVTTLDPSTQPIATYDVSTFDVAFPIIHGIGGEDGSLQAQLEELGLAYAGSDPAACQQTFDKSGYKQHLLQAGMPVPRGELIREQDLRDHPLAQQPFVLKPYDGGSSVDTFIIRDVASAPWDEMLAAVQKYDQMLIEELIEGVEITAAVLDEEALPIIEIVPPANGEFDYENKYNGATQELCPPQHVGEDIQQQARELALQVHALCGCRDMSRTDMMVKADGSLIILETNTLPGMTDQSLLPKAAGVAGYTMSQLCDKLVRMARDRGTDAA